MFFFLNFLNREFFVSLVRFLIDCQTSRRMKISTSSLKTTLFPGSIESFSESTPNRRQFSFWKKKKNLFAEEKKESAELFSAKQRINTSS